MRRDSALPIRLVQIVHIHLGALYGAEIYVFDDPGRGPDQVGMGAAGKLAADADTQNPQFAQGFNGQPEGQHVDRFRRDGFDHGGDLVFFANSRGIQSIGACLCIGGDARQHVDEIRLAGEKALRPRCQKHVRAAVINCLARRHQPRDRQIEIIERIIRCPA